MAQPSFWQRFFKSKQSSKKLQEPDMPQRISLHVDSLGSSGVDNFAGYYQEEYLSELTGRDAADVYDKMRRSDPKIIMALSATKNPIKGACWEIEPTDDEKQAHDIAEFIEFILFKDMDKTWAQTVHEILSCVDFGHSVFELVHKIVIDHPKYGNYNGIAQLGFRSQKTLERWNLDEKSGRLLSVSQYAFGDLQRLVDIPAEYLLTFSLNKEGDLYEGVSMLRPCYGAWLRKNLYLKMMAIGIEKYAVPTPIIKVPEGKENTDQFDKMIAAVRRYMSHQQSFLTVPTGWELEITPNPFDAEKIREAINAENVEIVHGFLANFLELGQSGAGSYALSFDLSDFFLSGLEHIANQICEVFNAQVIPQLVEMNFGAQENYPKLTCHGITDKAGKELAETVKLLVDSKAIIPDDKLEESMRERYGLPEKSDIGQRQVQTQQFGNQPPQEQAQNQGSSKPSPIVTHGEEDMQMSEPKQQIKDAQSVLRELMQENVRAIGRSLTDQILKKWESLPESKKVDAIKDNKPKGKSEYFALLLEHFSSEALRALNQAKKEAPGKVKDIKLAESDYEQLPLNMQRKIKARTQLVLDSQSADLEKITSYQYLSSMDTDSYSVLASDMNTSVDQYVDGPSIAAASGTISSAVVNEVRSAFFFDDEVLNEIASFTFVNGDPVSEICQALAGTVFEKDDPQVDQYWPPLHHNCKSTMQANYTGTKNADKEITDQDKAWRKSVAAAQDSVTLAEMVFGSTLVVLSVSVSKKIASTLADAQRIAQQYGASVQMFEETEHGYSFKQQDSSVIADGSLRSFEPMEGITMFYGMPKQQIPEQAIPLKEPKKRSPKKST